MSLLACSFTLLTLLPTVLFLIAWCHSPPLSGASLNSFNRCNLLSSMLMSVPSYWHCLYDARYRLFLQHVVNLFIHELPVLCLVYFMVVIIFLVKNVASKYKNNLSSNVYHKTWDSAFITVGTKLEITCVPFLTIPLLFAYLNRLVMGCLRSLCSADSHNEIKFSMLQTLTSSSSHSRTAQVVL